MFDSIDMKNNNSAQRQALAPAGDNSDSTGDAPAGCQKQVVRVLRFIENWLLCKIRLRRKGSRETKDDTKQESLPKRCDVLPAAQCASACRDPLKDRQVSQDYPRCKPLWVETCRSIDERLQRRMKDTHNTMLFGGPSDIELLIKEDALLGFGDTRVTRMQVRSLIREIYLKVLYAP